MREGVAVSAREAILVVSDKGKGVMTMFETVLEESGCAVIRTTTKEATRSVRKFIGEFGQGIPVSIIYGQRPDQASALAGMIRRECEGMRIIAISDVVGQATVDAERDYDVIIPENSEDLRNVMNAFLGL